MSSRNPFFHAPAPSEPATITGMVIDIVAGIVIVATICTAGTWLEVLTW